MENKQFSFIKAFREEQRLYRKEKRSELLKEVANWSSVVILGTMIGLLFWIAFIL